MFADASSNWLIYRNNWIRSRQVVVIALISYIGLLKHNQLESCTLNWRVGLSVDEVEVELCANEADQRPVITRVTFNRILYGTPICKDYPQI